MWTPIRTHSATVLCTGCGALVPESDGPTHAYIGASPGCWAIYGEVLAREYGEYGFPAVHRLTVDAYAVQHAGMPERRSQQSVGFHLMSMCLVLERGVPLETVTKAMRYVVRPDYPWLEPPKTPYEMTVLDVHAARDRTDHVRVVERWSRCVWEAWSVHHAAVRQWIAAVE